MHLFGHTFDHDYYFELPSEGERDAQSITRCLTSHHSDVQVVPRANRTFSLARNPIPCASSSKGEPSFRAMATLAIFRPRRIVLELLFLVMKSF
jgi:hypothetical protein